MEYLHHRILFPLFPTYVPSPIPKNALSWQEGHTPRRIFPQAGLLYKVSTSVTEEY